MQRMLAAVTAFYRWKLDTEQWKMQAMQEEFEAERVTVMSELYGLLSQIDRLNSFEREAINAARTRGAAVSHELLAVCKILQDATEAAAAKAPKRVGTSAR